MKNLVTMLSEALHSTPSIWYRSTFVREINDVNKFALDFTDSVDYSTQNSPKFKPGMVIEFDGFDVAIRKNDNEDDYYIVVTSIQTDEYEDDVVGFMIPFIYNPKDQEYPDFFVSEAFASDIAKAKKPESEYSEITERSPNTEVDRIKELVYIVTMRDDKIIAEFRKALPLK